MKKTWGDKRYYSLNYFLREKFGQKVFKISLDGGFSCPNRDGKAGIGGCTFCSSKGSGDFAGSRKESISDQFDNIKLMMNKKWQGDKYIAYFQAYSNTYASVDILKSRYDEAINKDGVVALAIATRPDCIDDEVVELLAEYNKKVYVWVELGLQTSNEESAKHFNRGYTNEVFENAVNKLRNNGIDVVTHVIFGLPGEDRNHMLDSIKYATSKDIQGIKIHLLHLMSETSMVKDYESGLLKFLDMDEYIDLICESISVIPQNIVIHRLTGDAPREQLIGPMWSLKKWEVLNAIDAELASRDIYQGKNI